MLDLTPRALSRLETSYVVEPSGCWRWTGVVSSGGYGRFSFRGRKWTAARVMYEVLVGPIPDGLQLDHLCRNRACVNPDHVEPVTGSINTLRGLSPILTAARSRKEFCVRGHPFALYGQQQPGHRGRSCTLCLRLRGRLKHQRRRLQDQIDSILALDPESSSPAHSSRGSDRRVPLHPVGPAASQKETR